MSPVDSLMTALGRHLGLPTIAIWILLLLPSIVIFFVGAYLKAYIGSHFLKAEAKQRAQHEEQMATLSDALRFGTEKRLKLYERRLDAYAQLLGVLAEDLFRARSEDGELLMRKRPELITTPEERQEASWTEERIRSLQVERLRLIRELGRLRLLVHAFEGESELSRQVDDCIAASPFFFGRNAEPAQRQDAIDKFEAKMALVSTALNQRIREEVSLLEREGSASN